MSLRFAGFQQFDINPVDVGGFRDYNNVHRTAITPPTGQGRDDMPTITITASNATASTTVETEGAMDYDIAIGVNEQEPVKAEVTLIPSGKQNYDLLDSWGNDLQHWLTNSAIEIADTLDRPGREQYLRAIVEACRMDEPQTVDVENDEAA